MEKRSCACREIPVLHATPVKWIPSIIKNGFQHTKEHKERASFGRGSGEGDLFFFERYNELGVRSVLSWVLSLERQGENAGENGIVEATVCSCNFLSARTLREMKKWLVRDGVKFIFKARDMPEDKWIWALEHFGSKLESPSFDDPMSFLRKIANESDHIIKDENGNEIGVRRYGIGEVMNFLGFDAADGFVGSHQFSKFRDQPMNELIVSNPDIIYDIKQVDIEDLCSRYAYEKDIKTACEMVLYGR